MLKINVNNIRNERTTGNLHVMQNPCFAYLYTDRRGIAASFRLSV